MNVATAYDEIAESRPRLRRDILFTETPSGVLFHNADGGFSLNSRSAYRFAALFAPHFDGGTSVSALTEGLGAPQRDMVAGLVDALYRHGFARDAASAEPATQPAPAPEVAARFSAQIGYVDHYADQGSDRFQRFRNSRVAVLGEDALARWCALGLIRNGCAAVGVPDADGFEELRDEARALDEAGCPVRIESLERTEDGWAGLDGYDVVVVTGGPVGTRRLSRLLSEGVPAGRALLPAWTFGRQAVIGPLMESGSACCWVCAVLRMGGNGAAADSAAVWSGIAPGSPLEPEQPVLSRPLAGMLGNLLAFEVFRTRTGALPPETANRLVVQDLDTLDAVAEQLLAHPRCPYCSTADDADAADNIRCADDTGTIELGSGLIADPARRSTVDEMAGEEAKQAALDELAEREVLIGARTGVFTGFADDDWNQSPIKVSTVVLGLGHGQRREISAFDLHHVAAARLRALRRSAEVYVERAVPLRGILRGAALTAARAGRPLVAPQRFATASGVGTPVERIHGWAPAASLTTGRSVLVPVGALRTFGGHNEDRAFEQTSAGTGAGGSQAEAVRRGLSTLLSYDGLRRALRHGAPVAEVTGQAFVGDPELTFLASSAENLGIQLELLRIGDPVGGPGQQALPVLLARCVDPETGCWRWAVGCDPDSTRAAVAAMRDLLGQVQLGREPGAEDGVDGGDPLFRDLDCGALTGFGEVNSLSGPVIGWQTVLERLRDSGRDVLVAPEAAPDLRAGGISAARVLLVDGLDGTGVDGLDGNGVDGDEHVEGGDHGDR